MSEILIQCQDLHKRYGRKEALCGVNLRLESGKIVGLLGPNGSGKTTLIKILNGLLKPDQGMVTIDGEEPGIHTKSVISYLPDKPYFADWMKITDLLELFEDFYEDFDRARAEKMCQELGIDTKLKMKILSKGNKEKVQLVLVMSRQAKLYLLDEPIAGVDPAARDFILSTILNNYNPDGTVLISTNPKVTGVLVIAEGGGNTKVKAEILEAVQALFGIEPHKIKIMKMGEGGNIVEKN